MQQAESFLTEILKTFPPQKLEATPKLVAQMEGLIEDMMQRIMRLCANDPKHYGWALLSAERINQVISSAFYLRMFEVVPEAFTDITKKQDGKRFGITLRRFFMSKRLNPGKVLPLAGINDAAVFLMAAKPLIEQ